MYSIYKIDLGIQIPLSFARNGYDIKFSLVDQRRSCRRPLVANDMFFTGDEIVYEFQKHVDWKKKMGGQAKISSEIERIYIMMPVANDGVCWKHVLRRRKTPYLKGNWSDFG